MKLPLCFWSNAAAECTRIQRRRERFAGLRRWAWNAGAFLLNWLIYGALTALVYFGVLWLVADQDADLDPPPPPWMVRT